MPPGFILSPGLVSFWGFFPCRTGAGGRFTASTVFTEKSYQIGLIWLALLSSLALADRINLLKSQTEMPTAPCATMSTDCLKFWKGYHSGWLFMGGTEAQLYQPSSRRVPG